MKFLYSKLFLFRFASIVMLFFLISACSLSVLAQQSKAKTSKFRGWDYLVELLIKDGYSEDELLKIFANKKMPRFTWVTFKLKPKESKRIYQGFFKEKNINACLKYLNKHKSFFDRVEQLYGVNRFVVAAILLIETQYGANTGNHMAINRLSRLASIDEPENLKYNFKNLKKEDPQVTFKDVADRGHYLQRMFYPEIPALIQIARKRNISIFSIKGSRAGAFGLSQFLPTTFIKFAVDGDQDGKISLFQHGDAILSVGNFLSSFGWKDDLSDIAKQKVLWKYNHSEAYVMAVLTVASKARQRLAKD